MAGLLLFLIFVVLPLVELAVMVWVASHIGVLDTIGLVVLLTLVGVWLCKRAGLGVLRHMRATIEAGQVPAADIVEGALVAVAGLLLVLPGFVGDAVALLLLLPPTRRLVRVGVLALVGRRFAGVAKVTRVVIRPDQTSGAWIDVDGTAKVEGPRPELGPSTNRPDAR